MHLQQGGAVGNIGPKDELTTSAREHLTIRTKLDTVDRAMMALEHFTFLARNVVYADPFVAGAARNEAILQDGVDRRGRWRIR